MEQEIPFELLALQSAVRYQEWMADMIRPFLGQRILEIGAGIGNMSAHLPVRELLVLSEAEKHLLPSLSKRAHSVFGEAQILKQRVQILPLELGDPITTQLHSFNFDTIISFNVLEHIQNDKNALIEFREILSNSQAPGPKKIISVVPAHSWAFGSIDKSYGHYRRYNQGGFRELAKSAGFPVEQPGIFTARYFNLAGLPGWYFLNRILRKKKLDIGPVLAFEKICPLIRHFDDFLHTQLHIPFGQSLLCVLELPEKNLQ